VPNAPSALGNLDVGNAPTASMPFATLGSFGAVPNVALPLAAFAQGGFMGMPSLGIAPPPLAVASSALGHAEDVIYNNGDAAAPPSLQLFPAAIPQNLAMSEGSPMQTTSTNHLPEFAHPTVTPGNATTTTSRGEQNA